MAYGSNALRLHFVHWNALRNQTTFVGVWIKRICLRNQPSVSHGLPATSHTVSIAVRNSADNSTVCLRTNFPYIISKSGGTSGQTIRVVPALTLVPRAICVRKCFDNLLVGITCNRRYTENIFAASRFASFRLSERSGPRYKNPCTRSHTTTCDPSASVLSHPMRPSAMNFVDCFDSLNARIVARCLRLVRSTSGVRCSIFALRSWNCGGR